MLTKITDHLTLLLLENSIIQEDEKEIYCYGFAVFITNMATSLSVLILGILLNSFFSVIIFIAVSVALKSFTGGFHAKSYINCFILSHLMYLTIYFLLNFTSPKLQQPLSLLFMVVSIIIIVLKAPVVNHNKPKTDEEILHCKKNARKILVFISIIFTVFYLIGNSCIGFNFVISCTVLQIAISILVVLNQKEDLICQ